MRMFDPTHQRLVDIVNESPDLRSLVKQRKVEEALQEARKILASFGFAVDEDQMVLARQSLQQKNH